MRWIVPRPAKVKPENREMFERFGVTATQTIMANGGGFEYAVDGVLKRMTAQQVLPEMQLWLTEQWQRAETKETWSFTMEIAITIFVALEAVSPILHAYDWICSRL